jgi:hypothetical protein
MSNRARVVLVSLAVTWGVSASFGDSPRTIQEPKKPGDAAATKTSDLMKRKLGHAQAVLEALALNDFDKIRSNADDLIFISKQVEWRAVKTPEYDLSMNSFRRAAEELAQKAKDKNLEGATLAYMDMTMTCVRCHKQVRDMRRTQLDLPGKSSSIACGEE